jgi:hypothetical protein
MAARTLSGFDGSNIIGIKAIVLTSRAAQVYNGILADKATKVDKNKDQQNNH